MGNTVRSSFFVLTVLLLVAAAANSEATGRLGQKNRELQSPGTIVLNALVETFLPAVVDDLETNIAQDLDPVLLDFETTEQFNVTLGGGSANDTTACQNYLTSASVDTVVVAAVERAPLSDDDDNNETYHYNGEITYAIGEMSGMSTMDIASVSLVDGTQDINIPALAFFGAQGSTWSGTWDAVANFDKFELSTTATLNMTALNTTSLFCNTTSYTEVETGTFTIWKPLVTITIYVEGETDNIYRFNDESIVSVARVESIAMTYENITGDLGDFDDLAVVSVIDPFIDTFDWAFAEGSEFFATLIGFVQEEVNKEIPFSLS